MFPENMDNVNPKVIVLEQCNTTKLTAYNGTSIPHYGTITLNCRKRTVHGHNKMIIIIIIYNICIAPYNTIL